MLTNEILSSIDNIDDCVMEAEMNVINAMINENCKDKDALALVKYISEDEREEKLLANQQVLKTPIVRNGNQASIGYAPEIWKSWT